MPLLELAVTATGATAVAPLARYFFRGTTTAAEVTVNGQAATVVVRGGYQPDAVQARTGSPLLVSLDRREDGDCSAGISLRQGTHHDAQKFARSGRPAKSARRTRSP